MKNIKYLLFAISILFLSSFCVDNTFCLTVSELNAQSVACWEGNGFTFWAVPHSAYPTELFFYYNPAGTHIGWYSGSYTRPNKVGYWTIYSVSSLNPSPSLEVSGTGSSGQSSAYPITKFIKEPLVYDTQEAALSAVQSYLATGVVPSPEPGYTYNDSFDDFKLSLIGLTTQQLFGDGYCMSYNAIITYPSLLSGTKYDFFEMGVKGSKGEETYKITDGLQHQFIDCNEFCNVGEKVYVKCTGYKGTEYGKTVCAIIDTSVNGFNIFTGTPVKPSFVVDTPESDNPSDIISNKEYINILAQGNISYSYNTSRDYIYDINTSNISYTEESYIINNVTNKGNEVTNNYVENIVNNTYNITYTYNYGDSDIDIPEFKNQFKLNFDKAFTDVTSYLSVLSDYGIPQTFITTLVFGIGFISIAVVIKIVVIVIGAIL